MQAHATVRTSTKVNRQSHASSFAKVCDARKQPIRGLWVRNGRYYAQLKVENPITGIKKTRRVPLIDKDGVAVTTTAQAVAELKRLQTQRTDNTLPTLTRTQKFSDYAKHYLTVVSKKAGTMAKEKTLLGRWADHLGGLRIDQIKRVHVNRFIEARLKIKSEDGKPLSPRTINLDVIALRVVLKQALSDGLIQRLPTEGLRPLKTVTRKKSLFTAADLEIICAAANETKRDKKGKEIPVTENAQQFTDYIRLMALCGSRRNETLGFKWDDVDFDNAQLFVRRQITERGIEDLKNSEQRVVDFNPKLKAHLEEMKKRKAPDSDWLFPSPQRGDKDIPAKTFRESLEMVRTQAGMPLFNFHDCRHHFISMAVMSGVDFMTIAAWVGHKDGGVLIGKVYGHLANDHRKAMADKMNFGPAVLEKSVNQ